MEKVLSTLCSATYKGILSIYKVKGCSHNILSSYRTIRNVSNNASNSVKYFYIITQEI